MTEHSILEIDEQELRACRVEVHRSSAVVVDARRVPLVDHGVAALVAGAEAVRPVLGDKTQVLLASRRFLFLRLELPCDARRHAAEAIEREFRRRGHFDHESPLLIGSRSEKSRKRKFDIYSAVALPENDWSAYQRALDRLETDIACVRSLEDCIARGIVDHGEGVSLFADQVGSRLRLVTCVDGSVAQVRRLPLPPSADGGSDRIDFVLGQLAIEIPRTIEVLRRDRVDPPRRLVLGESLRVPRAQLGLLDSVLDEEVAFFEAKTDPGEVPLSLGAAIDGVVSRVRSGETRRWESRGGQRREDEPVRRKAPRVGWMPIAAAAAPLLLAGVVGTLQNGATDTLRQRNTSLEQELRNRQERGVLEGAREVRTSTFSIQGMRRPSSLAHAELCAIAPPSITYDRLQLTYTDGLLLEGHVTTGSRAESLAAIATLVERASALEYLSGLSDSLSESDGGRIEFRLRARWRKP